MTQQEADRAKPYELTWDDQGRYVPRVETEEQRLLNQTLDEMWDVDLQTGGD